MSKNFVLLVLLICVFAIAGCAESTIEKVDKDIKPASTPASEKDLNDAAKEEAKDEPKAAETFTIGDTVKFNDLEITLNGVRSDEGSEYFKPKNDTYLVIDLTIENKGDEAANLSTLLSMSVYDAESFKGDIAIFLDTKGSLDGEVGVGRKIRGEVAFDVSNSEFYEFVYEDPFAKGQAIWKFEVTE